MKLFRFLLVVGFLAICASAARADGVDPSVKVQGVCSTNCDAVVIGPGQDSVSFTETITCSSPTDPTSCTASDDVINFSGTTLTSFQVSLSSPGLTFSCGSEPLTDPWVCTPLGAGLFAFTPASGTPAYCSTDGNDIYPTYNPSNPGPYTYKPDGDADDNCSQVIVSLQGTSSETVQELNNAVVNATLGAPEPSSLLLLLFGFMAGIVVLKLSRGTLA